MNPCPEGIHRFRGCTMIQADLGSLIRNPDHPKGKHAKCMKKKKTFTILTCNETFIIPEIVILKPPVLTVHTAHSY